MLKYSVFVNSVLLLTVPSFALYSQADLPVAIVPVQKPVKIGLQSYDDILNLIDDLEDGELEKQCNQADLERINYFLANLATQGILADESEEESLALKDDIQELLEGEDNPYEYYFSMNIGDNCIVIPAVDIDGQGEIILCKSWKELDETRL